MAVSPSNKKRKSHSRYQYSFGCKRSTCLLCYSITPRKSTRNQFPSLRRATTPLSLEMEGSESGRHANGLAGLLDLTKLLSAESLGIGVEAELNLLVLERVLLLDTTALSLGIALGSAEDALNFRGVDEAGKVGLGDHVGGKEEALLALVDGVELLDGRGSPDDEAAEVTTRGELEEVEGIDGAGLDTGDVAEALGDVLAVGLGAVDDEGTAALAVAAASELTLTST